MSKFPQIKSGDEYDAIGPWRRFHRFRPGVRKRIKRGVNKRFRKAIKQYGQEDSLQ